MGKESKVRIEFRHNIEMDLTSYGRFSRGAGRVIDRRTIGVVEYPVGEDATFALEELYYDGDALRPGQSIRLPSGDIIAVFEEAFYPENGLRELRFESMPRYLEKRFYLVEPWLELWLTEDIDE